MRDQQKICREEWFKDHVATLHIATAPTAKPVNTITVIEWKKPNSWNYGCRFLLHSQWLMVVGDLGEATYQWSEPITMEFLAGLNFDYFHGKCRASPSGSRSRVWDPRTAQRRLQDIADQCGAACSTVVKQLDESRGDEKFGLALSDLYAHGKIGCDMASELSECGYIPDPMCVGHFVGLQMAIKQITTPATVVTP